MRRAPPGYPNSYVQLAIATHLPDRGRNGHLPTSRNHLNVLSSDALIALPGSFGTLSEVQLALEYGKPLVVFSPDESLVAHFPVEATRVRTISEVEDFLRRHIRTVRPGDFQEG